MGVEGKEEGVEEAGLPPRLVGEERARERGFEARALRVVVVAADAALGAVLEAHGDEVDDVLHSADPGIENHVHAGAKRADVFHLLGRKRPDALSVDVVKVHRNFEVRHNPALPKSIVCPRNDVAVQEGCRS